MATTAVFVAGVIMRERIEPKFGSFPRLGSATDTSPPASPEEKQEAPTRKARPPEKETPVTSEPVAMRQPLDSSAGGPKLTVQPLVLPEPAERPKTKRLALLRSLVILVIVAVVLAAVILDHERQTQNRVGSQQIQTTAPVQQPVRIDDVATNMCGAFEQIVYAAVNNSIDQNRFSAGWQPLPVYEMAAPARSVNPRLYAMLIKSIELARENPGAMYDSLRNGNWVYACGAVVRGSPR